MSSIATPSPASRSSPDQDEPTVIFCMDEFGSLNLRTRPDGGGPGPSVSVSGETPAGCGLATRHSEVLRARGSTMG